MNLRESILERYLGAQRDLTEIEQVDESNVVLSLPLHFSEYARIELAVTQISDDYFAISDMAQTLGELKDAGVGITDKVKERITSLVKVAGLEFRGNHLLRQCSGSQLGEAISQFAETAKTIGDAYLVYRGKRKVEEEDELLGRVRRVFIERKYSYSERQEVTGQIETHTVDFLIPSNGTRGLALAVLPNPSQIIAEAWGFKTQDIRNANEKLAVSVVYDSSRAKEVSRTILEKMADVPIPSTSVGDLAAILEKTGILPHN